MENKGFIRHVLILGDKDDLNLKVKDCLLAGSKKIQVEIVPDRNEVSQKLGNFIVSAVFLNFAAVSEALYALRLLGMYMMKTNKELKVFFSSSNFETFQHIINETSLDNVDVIPYPFEAKELSHKIIDKLFDRKMSKQVVTKSKSVLNVDLEFIQVFIEATKKTLMEMCQIKKLKHGKPVFQEKMETPLDMAIASKILISSEFFKGNFYVIFPKSTFLKIYENAVMEEATEINDENKDFAGEIANIIYGQSKKVLSASGLNLDMAIPSIDLGTKIDSEIVIIIPFYTETGPFYIAVAPGNL